MLAWLKILLLRGNGCERCGSKDRVKRVYVSNFMGQGHYENLCPRCELMEKMKRY